MRLVIAEKPSVAQSIAAVLGAKSRHDGYLEGGGYIVSWCFGHLAELADAAVYNADDAKWTLAALPIIPTSFRFIVRSEKQKQFDILRELMRRGDVAEVVNACDAGREGELIFRTVYCLAGCSKPILRLWISSMEDDAIRSGFQQLKSGRDYDGLHQSALCRAKADWLVGINATRYFSLTYGRTLNIGRVMSPTLALLVQREAEISAFVAEPFYTVQLDCGFPATTDRMKDRKDADAIANACKGKTVTVKSVERKEKSEKAPALYDLTSLQRDANRILGYDRTFHVLAITVCQADWDRRYSPDNRAWANAMSIPANPDTWGTDRNCYLAVNSHPGLVELFLSQTRKAYAQERQKTSVRDKLKKPPETTSPKISAKSKAPER